MDRFSEEQLDKLEKLSYELNELSSYLETVEIMSDNKLFRHYQKRYNEIQGIVQNYLKYKKLCEDFDLLSQMEISSEVEKQEIVSEKENIETEKENLFKAMSTEMFNLKNVSEQAVIVEITVKNDSSELTKLLFEVLQKYCKNNAFDFQGSAKNDGYVVNVKGKGVFEKLSKLSGVAKQIANGKETFATVVVLEEKQENLSINESDFKIETIRSGGAGGQHINKTESAVRVTHIPTGITVRCEDERSQTQNKERAIKLIKQKIEEKTRKNKENYIKNQRNNIKNAIFSTTETLIFDFDRNRVNFQKQKESIKLSDALDGNLPL